MAITSAVCNSFKVEVLKAVHPHPTMSEAVMEAVADAYDEVIHL